MLIRGTRIVVIVFGMALLLAPSVFAETYEIDNNHSSSSFRVKHNGVSFVHGMIPEVSGRFNFDSEDPEANSIEMSARVSSLSTFNEDRDKHLAGPDFFNAKQFPVITFESTSWKKTAENMYEITGQFAMLGVEKAITVKAEHVGSSTNRDGQSMTGFEVTVKIDRTDFGMNYGVSEDGSGLGAEVDLTISIEANAE